VNHQGFVHRGHLEFKADQARIQSRSSQPNRLCLQRSFANCAFFFFVTLELECGSPFNVERVRYYEGKKIEGLAGFQVKPL
jgi:hypothetical protein